MKKYTAAVCENRHAWPAVLTVTQETDAKGSVLANRYELSVNECPTCGQEWQWCDPSRLVIK